VQEQQGVDQLSNPIFPRCAESDASVLSTLGYQCKEIRITGDEDTVLSAGELELLRSGIPLRSDSRFTRAY